MNDDRTDFLRRNAFQLNQLNASVIDDTIAAGSSGIPRRGLLLIDDNGLKNAVEDLLPKRTEQAQAPFKPVRRKAGRTGAEPVL